jgi:hypothetical protein
MCPNDATSKPVLIEAAFGNDTRLETLQSIEVAFGNDTRLENLQSIEAALRNAWPWPWPSSKSGDERSTFPDMATLRPPTMAILEDVERSSKILSAHP